MEGTSLFTNLIRDPPKKLPKPTPKVVIARPVTFWFARRVTVRKQYSNPINRDPNRQQSIGIAMARNPFMFAASPADLS